MANKIPRGPGSREPHEGRPALSYAAALKLGAGARAFLAELRERPRRFVATKNGLLALAALAGLPDAFGRDLSGKHLGAPLSEHQRGRLRAMAEAKSLKPDAAKKTKTRTRQL